MKRSTWKIIAFAAVVILVLVLVFGAGSNDGRGHSPINLEHDLQEAK